MLRIMLLFILVYSLCVGQYIPVITRGLYNLYTTNLVAATLTNIVGIARMNKNSLAHHHVSASLFPEDNEDQELSQPLLSPLHHLPWSPKMLEDLWRVN